MPNDQFNVPVLIVGGGPGGLTSSLLLSRLGIRSLLVERRSRASDLPKAHILNQRTMEIFDVCGVADEVYERGSAIEFMSRVAWYTSLVGPTELHGREIVRRDSWGGGADAPAYAAASRFRSTNLPQMHLEPILRRHAEALASGRRAVRARAGGSGAGRGRRHGDDRGGCDDVALHGAGRVRDRRRRRPHGRGRDRQQP